MLRISQTLSLVAVLLVSSAVVVRSQSVASGTVTGTITDPSGAVVSGAQVTLADVATGSTQSVTTNGAGHYIFVNVDPGHYDISVIKQGFATSKTSSDVRVGLTTNVNLPFRMVAPPPELGVRAGPISRKPINPP